MQFGSCGTCYSGFERAYYHGQSAVVVEILDGFIVFGRTKAAHIGPEGFVLIVFGVVF